MPEPLSVTPDELKAAGELLDAIVRMTANSQRAPNVFESIAATAIEAKGALVAAAAALEATDDALEYAEGNLADAQGELRELVGGVVLEQEYPGLGRRVAAVSALVNGARAVLLEARAAAAVAGREGDAQDA